MSASVFANNPAALGAPGSGGFLPARLEGEIRRIYSRSPIYGRRFPIHPEPLQWSCYQEIPALSKREIVEAGHQSFFADYRGGGARAGRPPLRVREHLRHDGGADDGHHGGRLVGGADAAGLPGLADPSGVRRPAAPQVRPGPGRLLEQPLPVRGPSLPAPLFRRDRVPEPVERPLRLLGGGVGPDRRSSSRRRSRRSSRASPCTCRSSPARPRGAAIRVPSIRAVILTYGKASLQHGRRIAEAFPGAAGRPLRLDRGRLPLRRRGVPGQLEGDRRQRVHRARAVARRRSPASTRST